jgi:hypothetical protein
MSESKDSLVEQWAADNGYELLRSEYRMQSQGPFSGPAAAKKQPVFYVQVRDPSGKTRSGWIRFRSRLFGLLSDKTDVKWEG